MYAHHKHSHIYQYILLFLILVTAFFSFVNCTGQAIKQIQIVALGGIYYTLWGIFHHYYNNDLNWKIVVEYIAISFVGITMLWMLLSYIY